MESPRSFSSKYLVQASRQVSITSLSNYQQLSYGKGMVPKSVAVTLDVDDPAMVLQTVENGIWLEVVQDLRGEPLASFEEPGNEPGAIVGQLQQKLFFMAAMGDVPDAAWNVMTKSSCTPPLKELRGMLRPARVCVVFVPWQDDIRDIQAIRSRPYCSYDPIVPIVHSYCSLIPPEEGRDIQL